MVAKHNVDQRCNKKASLWVCDRMTLPNCGLDAKNFFIPITSNAKCSHIINISVTAWKLSAISNAIFHTVYIRSRKFIIRYHI